MRHFIEIAFLFFLLLLPSLLLTQDSLHLVGTITGETGTRITDVKDIDVVGQYVLIFMLHTFLIEYISIG